MRRSGVRVTLAAPPFRIYRIKDADDVLKPDVRFAGLYVVREGHAWRMELADHHAGVAGIQLKGAAPPEVRSAFDRARNALVYAYFDCDLFLVGEVQVFGAFELALKHRLNGHGGAPRGTLRNLVNQARKAGIFPPVAPAAPMLMDPIEALVSLRNGLLHGTEDVHSPGMALEMVEACARAVDEVFPE